MLNHCVFVAWVIELCHYVIRPVLQKTYIYTTQFEYILCLVRTSSRAGIDEKVIHKNKNSLAALLFGVGSVKLSMSMDMMLLHHVNFVALSRSSPACPSSQSDSLTSLSPNELVSPSERHCVSFLRDSSARRAHQKMSQNTVTLAPRPLQSDEL